MERPPTTMLQIGDWRVDPASGQISRGAETARLEARTMRLLLRLAERPGQVVSIDDLLNQVWSEVSVSPDSVYQAVASLRRLLGDEPRQPTYIETVPRLGYRLVATVKPWDPVNLGRSTEMPASTAKTPSRNSVVRLRWAAGGAICLALVMTAMLLSVFRGRSASDSDSGATAIAAPPQKSIAVLPFLDLTEGMQEETFADGMTEELIGRLSKVPGLRVPAPTSSFYFKGKQVPLADIAKRLSVAYVLDGSVRKSGIRVRVAARLILAENGYVVWSETYDRPFDDLLMVQDDIAGAVTKALAASIGANPSRQ